MSLAYAKLQALNGQDAYITELPYKIGSNRDCNLQIDC